MIQAYTQAAVRFLVVFGCAGMVLFALQMSEPEPKHGMCNAYHATDCYDRLRAR
jgi:hypothetical protein